MPYLTGSPGSSPVCSAEGKPFLRDSRSYLPWRATLTTPRNLVFDTRLERRINAEHIIVENTDRFPPSLRQMGDYALCNLLTGAIETAIERVARNYKAAVPQFYRGRVQLLLPLCLTEPARADLALVFEKFDSHYRASTCLTLDMAYNNARLLARPDRDWLQP